MTHRALPAVLTLALFSVQPADAVLTDDEPSNDTIATVGAPQIAPIAAVTTDGGEFALIFGDIDYLAIGDLSVGDIVTVSTTPLGDEILFSPDTVIGLFSDGATKRCEGDDSINNELMIPDGTGSLCRVRIDSPGTWFVGVTGWSVDPFAETHFHDGVYQLVVTINPIPEPGAMLQLVSGGAGLAWFHRRRKRHHRPRELFPPNAGLFPAAPICPIAGEGAGSLRVIDA